MSSPASTGPIESMFRHLPALRNYARQAISSGHGLTENQEQDKIERLRIFFQTGSSLNWTEKEMVTLLLREVMAG